MSLNLISNFAANVAHRNLVQSDMAATSSLARLSLGTRVLGAKDDSASLAVGSRLNVEVVGLKQASVNTGEAISMLQIADGAMAQVNTILTRMKALSIQSGSGHLGVVERAILDTEYQSLLSEADRIANDTDFAGTVLASGSTTVTQGANFLVTDGVVNVTFRGDFSADLAPTMAFDEGTDGFTVAHNGIDYTGTISSSATSVLIGGSMTSPTVVTLSNATNSNKIDIALNTTFDSGTDAGPAAMALLDTSITSFTYKVGTGASTSADSITVTVNSIAANALGIDGTDILTAANADEASVQIATAVNSLQTARAMIGASQNRLNFAAANLATASENAEAARSQLLDLDVAQEMTTFTSNQILVQAGVSMLAQANQLPQNLMQLFR
jgi:flagellin